MSFIADRPLRDVGLQVSPSLRPAVTIAPQSLAHVPAGQAVGVRLAILMPPSATPGRSVVGLILVRAGRRALAPVELELQVVPSTPEGTLRSLRLALEERSADAYAAQFAPERQARERETFQQLADPALDRLADALRGAERIGLSDDGRVADYRIPVRLEPHQTETTIRLRRDAAGIWRLVRF